MSGENRWRVVVRRADSTTHVTFDDGSAARHLFETLELGYGERAEYQIKHAGKSRYLTWGWRDYSPPPVKREAL